MIVIHTVRHIICFYRPFTRVLPKHSIYYTTKSYSVYYNTMAFAIPHWSGSIVIWRTESGMSSMTLLGFIKWLPIYTGVPQRSILSPLLFVVYMNDINVVSSQFSFILYADDTTTVSSMCTFTNTSSQERSTKSNKINEEILKVSDWIPHNKLSLNVSKAKFIFFRNYQKVLPDTTVPKLKIHDFEIERLTEFNFLGLTINEYLDWPGHSNKIAHKISRTLGVMNRLKHELPYNALKMMYNAVTFSHMQFNITAWGYDFNRIFKLQNRTLHIMTCSKCNAHTDPIFKKLNLLKIRDIFNVHNFKIYYKYKKQQNFLNISWTCLQ